MRAYDQECCVYDETGARAASRVSARDQGRPLSCFSGPSRVDAREYQEGALEYGGLLRRKVKAGRGRMAAGHGVPNDEAEFEFEAAPCCSLEAIMKILWTPEVLVERLSRHTRLGGQRRLRALAN